MIVSNLNRKEALRRLKNMRKLEDNCKFAELSAKESVEAINGMGSHPGLWASIFPGDEQRYLSLSIYLGNKSYKQYTYIYIEYMLFIS